MATRTLAAATASDIRRNGWAVGLGHLVPAAVLALATKKIINPLTGIEMTAAEANAVRTASMVDRDLQTVNNAVGGLSMEQIAELANATARLNRNHPTWRAEQELADLTKMTAEEMDAASAARADVLRAQVEQRVAEKAAKDAALKDKAYGVHGLNKWDTFSAKFGKAVLGGAVKTTVGMARAFNRTLGGTTANLMALYRNPAIKQADPEIWQEALHGNIVDPDGKVRSLGDFIADQLNSREGMFHDILAKAFNADLALAVDDPIVKLFKLKKQAQSFAGFTGTLGRYWGGMGLTHAGDLTRAYTQYASVRRAFDFIAKSSASQIVTRFGANMFSAKLLVQLEKADTPQKVLSVLEDAFKGAEYVHATAPTMGWYSAAKAALSGPLGDRFGTLGRLVESDTLITDRIAETVKKETGFDFKPNAYQLQKMNPAGKLRVTIRKRFRDQFVRSPEWYNSVLGAMSNREVVPGSIGAVDGIMNLFRSLHVPETTVLSVGDVLIHSASDPVAFRRAFNSALYEVVMRPQQAMMPHAEYEVLNNALSDTVRTEVEKLTGLDGGGNLGNYVATADEVDNEILTELGVSRAGIGSMHLGMLRMPTATEMRKLIRNTHQIVQELQSSEARQVILQTTATLHDWTQLAEFSKQSIESLLSTIRKVFTEKRLSVAEMWEREDIYKGYQTKFKTLMKRYEVWLHEDAFKGRTRPEKIALVAKDIADEFVRVRELYDRLALDISGRLGIVPPMLAERGESLAEWAASNGVTEEQILSRIDTLRGEYEAVQDMLANFNAHLNTAFDAGTNVIDFAKTVGALTLENTEARKKFVEQFTAKWQAAVDATGKNAVTRQSIKFSGQSGKRNLRNNAEMVADTTQAYNNKYFKPMTLSSPGWATRVSSSEIMLNALRMGGADFFEAHLAASIAKHEFRLIERYKALEAMGQQEKLVFRNVMASMMLGMEKSVLESMGNMQKARLIADATDLFMDHEGVIPMGMNHGSTDSMTNEALNDARGQMVHGVDPKDGKVVSGFYYRDDTFTTVNGTDAGAGTALHEQINSIYQDAILGVAAKWLHGEATAVGSAAFAANEGRFTKQIMDEALRRIESGAGAEAFQARNKFLDDLREEITNMAEYKALNEEERKQVLDVINGQAKTAGELVTDDFPKYLQARYDAANRRIAALEGHLSTLDNQIAAQTKLVDERVAEFLTATTGEESAAARISMGEALDNADRELRTLQSARTLLDKEISEHPFRKFYTTLEHGVALDPYKPILADLRNQMADQIIASRQAAADRIIELMGRDRVVLPRGGFAEMTDARSLVFRDLDGNPVPNQELYKQVFESHPELWSDNENYSRYLPFGMPGVKGRDFLDAVGVENIPELQRLIRYEQQMDALAEHMANRRYKQAYDIIHSLDPTTVSEFSPITREGTADMSRASDLFNINGVSPEIILGYGRTQEKTLADLALHVRQQNYMRPTIFRKSFKPNYTMDAEGEARFKEDFAMYFKALASDTATIREKEQAAKWFTAAVGPNPETWGTTANKVWKQNLDAARVTAARDADRKSYYELLEKRKELSAQASKVGVQKREIIKRGGIIPEVAPEETAAERTLVDEQKKLDNLMATRDAKEAQLAKAHGRRDELEQHVLAQDEKFRERATERAMRTYNARIRKGTRGMNALMRRVESRTNTLNAAVQRQARQVVNEVITAASSNALSGEASYADLMERLTDYMYGHLSSLPADELVRYQRAHYCSATNSTGDPLLDWSRVIAKHMLTLSTGHRNKTFFPEIVEQMATGNTWGPRKTAEWLSSKARAGEDYVTNIPARSFVSPFSKGSMSNILIHLSDRMHSKVLGPIVNELVREPLFVLEYHKQMEYLRIKVEQKLLTEDQAKIIAKTNAVIEMNQFVHDPLGKSIWENNMRVTAPYYFAKNQALRRAMRLAGGDQAAFYKYLRMNLAITNYINQNADGSNTFVVPGSQMLMSMGTGVLGFLGPLLGYKPIAGVGASNFGFDASGASLTSVLVTGTKAGFNNMIHEMIAVPFGPAVVMPAKFFYEYATHHNPVVEWFLSKTLGETSMRTSFKDDLLPNPLLRNTAKGMYGMAFQNNVSSYASVENAVIQDMAQQLFENFYEKAAADHPTLNKQQLAMFGSREQLWSYYAGIEFANYFRDAGNFQQFLHNANMQAALNFTMKNFISYSSPTAMSLGQRFLKTKEFQDIMLERDKETNELLYPTYALAANEFAKRYPDRVFDLVSRTKSGGSRWPETTAAAEFLHKHYSQLGKYSDAMAYLVSTNGDKYDPIALQMEYAFGLRKSQTPTEFLKSLMITLGWKWYNQAHDALLANPANVDEATGGLNYQAAMELRRMATTYGQTTNNYWLADKNAGTKNSVAYNAFNQMKEMVKDPKAASMFKDNELEEYRQMVDLRNQYEKAYADALVTGESTGLLRSQWYEYCTQLSNDEYWKKYSGFITNVLRNLPAPQ